MLTLEEQDRDTESRSDELGSQRGESDPQHDGTSRKRRKRRRKAAARAAGKGAGDDGIRARQQDVLADPASQALRPNSIGTSLAAVTLATLPGLEEARAWGKDLAQDLADYKAGRIDWRDVDPGALLHGPPGTGKTTFARALANTCGLELIVSSFREWMEKGDGALGDVHGAMRQLFDLARRKAPCIVFIDEVDSIPRRDHLGARYREWWIAVVNALLEFLDGSTSREGIVVLAACNNVEEVDPALRRAGRLDRELAIGLPGEEALTAIYRFHLGSQLVGESLEKVARLSIGLTGADVEQVVRDARRSARKGRRALEVSDLVRQLDTCAELPAQALRRAAVHEAGHALAAITLDVARSVSVAIGKRGDQLGMTVIEPNGHCQTRAVLERKIAVQLAGRAAETEILGDFAAGSGGGVGSDLERATRLAAYMDGQLGMGNSGSAPIYLGEEGMITLLLTSHEEADEIRRILYDAAVAAKEIARRHRAAILEVAERLLAERCLGDAQLRSIVHGHAGGAEPALNEA